MNYPEKTDIVFGISKIEDYIFKEKIYRIRKKNKPTP